MLAHSRNRVRTGVAAYCIPCSERQAARQSSVARTAGVEIGGAGIAEWQKTNKAIIQTDKELANWEDAYKKEAEKRRASGKTEGTLCTPTSPWTDCLYANEIESLKLITKFRVWIVDWNKLVSNATTGVPWGEDTELRQYQRQLDDQRKKFEEIANYKFLPIPAWSEDRGFFQAVKESTGADIPNAFQNVGLVVAGVGGLVLLTSLLKK